jgi:multiple sugar transport system ATP-binding protein
MSSVRLINLEKTYPPSGQQKAFQAVRGVNLEIKEGEFMVLVGPSGCGKSTTLRMIAGLEDITSGECWIGSQLVNEVPPKNRDIAMVFQNYALYPHMSVFENMSFGLKIQGVSRQEREVRVLQAAEILGITDLLPRKPKALSGGQRQRVAVGRAIVRKPKVFLFDEPLSNLDAKMRVSMRGELVKLHERLRATMIYVTHDQLEAMTMGDRITVLKDGLIQQVAPPIELYQKPQNMFVAGFIGSPPMNFLTGVPQEENGRLVFRPKEAAPDSCGLLVPDHWRAPLLASNLREFVLGIRPEDISCHEGQSSTDEPYGLRATVSIAEPTGAETFVTFTSGNLSLVAKLPSESAVRRQQTYTLSFKPRKLNFFCPRTEVSLRPNGKDFPA